MVINILVIINILLPILCIYHFCHNKNGIRLDHIFILSSGYLYYWITPIAMYRFNLIARFNESDFASFFNIDNILVSESLMINYLTIIIITYMSFILGEILSKKLKYKFKKIAPFSLKPLQFISFVYFILLSLLTTATYQYYFKGYTENIFDLKGSVIALNLFLLILLYLFYLSSEYSINFKNVYNNNIFYIYLLSSLLLLSLGNRTWIICGILSFYVLYTNYYNRILTKYIIFGFIFLIIGLGIFANIRSGNIDYISANNTIFLGLYDTFATHNSLKYYLINNEIYYFRFPIILLNNLLNIIPTLVMPDKASLLISTGDIGVDYQTIQGAGHAFPLLMIHFGIIGTFIISFATPFLLNYFKQSIYWKASYVVLVAHLAAPIFRDFDNFFIKIFIQVCLIMPFGYLLTCNIFNNRISNIYVYVYKFKLVVMSKYEYIKQIVY